MVPKILHPADFGVERLLIGSGDSLADLRVDLGCLAVLMDAAFGFIVLRVIVQLRNFYIISLLHDLRF